MRSRTVLTLFLWLPLAMVFWLSNSVAFVTWNLASLVLGKETIKWSRWNSY